jgi:hypothetical protein
MSISPPLSIHHAIPGRVRLGIEPLRGQPDEAARLAGAVGALPGVHGARASAVAASLVVEHDRAIALEALLVRLGAVPALARLGIHELTWSPPPAPVAAGRGTPTRAAAAILEAAARANAASHTFAAGKVDLKLVVPGLLASVGIARLLTGRAGPTPHWIVFLMYGFDAFAVLNQGAIRRFIEPPPAAVPASNAGA